jgi:hypothetical protein
MRDRKKSMGLKRHVLLRIEKNALTSIGIWFRIHLIGKGRGDMEKRRDEADGR